MRTPEDAEVVACASPPELAMIRRSPGMRGSMWNPKRRKDGDVGLVTQDALLAEQAARQRAEAEVAALTERNRALEAEAAQTLRLRLALRAQGEAVTQALGRALGYPRLSDDPANFPDSADSDEVCVGDHVAETLATEAAQTIAELRAKLERAYEALEPFATRPAANFKASDFRRASDVRQVIAADRLTKRKEGL